MRELGVAGNDCGRQPISGASSPSWSVLRENLGRLQNVMSALAGSETLEGRSQAGTRIAPMPSVPLMR
jgi:hypothetical protein